MAKLIYPHPNPPYLKNNGQPNILGRIELFDATNTSTSKVAYSDSAGTSYGSVIDLDSSGLPEDGPIYYEGKYHVKVYVRDDSGNLSEQYTVDDFGEENSLDEFTTTSLSWTVDGLGTDPDRYVSLSAAMDAARNTVFIGNGELTITVLSGLYVEDQPNLEHPQGEKITITGQGNINTQFQNTISSGAVLTLSNGFKLKALKEMGIQQTNGTTNPALLIDDGAEILNLSNVKIIGAGGGGDALAVAGGATLRGSGLETLTTTGKGLIITEGSRVWMNNYTHTGNATGTGTGSANAINVSGLGSVYTGDGTMLITGVIADPIVSALEAINHGSISTGDSLTINNADLGLRATVGGKINRESVPTFSGVTTNYAPSTLDTITSDGSSITTGGGSSFTIISSRQVSGMNLSIDSGDTDHDINVTAGVTLNHDLSDSIELKTAFTKQLDAAWAEGDDAGGWLSAGAVPTDGGIAVFVIKNPSTGQVDVGFDKETTLIPTLPSGYTVYRYIGWALVDGSSNLREQTWRGEYNLQFDEVADFIDDAIVNNAWATDTSKAPPNSILKYGVILTTDNNDAAYDFRARIRPKGSNFVVGFGFDSVSLKDDLWYENEVHLNDDQELEYLVNLTNVDTTAGVIDNWEIRIQNQGWIDLKRNNP